MTGCAECYQEVREDEQQAGGRPTAESFIILYVAVLTVSHITACSSILDYRDLQFGGMSGSRFTMSALGRAGTRVDGWVGFVRPMLTLWIIDHLDDAHGGG